MITPDDEWWDVWLADAGVPFQDRVRPRGGLRLDSQANEGFAAMGGQGFVLLTSTAGKETLPRADWSSRSARVSTRGFAYWLVYPPERRNLPKVKRFRECFSRSSLPTRALLPRSAVRRSAGDRYGAFGSCDLPA